MKPTLISAAILSVILLLPSCTSHPESPAGSNRQEGAAAGPGSLEPHTMRLQGAAGSIDALVKSAIDAYAAGDTVALQRLLITAEEFDRYLYPEFGQHYPAARDTSVQAREFVRENHMRAAAKGLRKSLKELGGRRMELISVGFRDGAKRFSTYTIHEGTEVKVWLEDGSEGDLPALGSIVEMDGRYKLLSYRDRE